MKGGCLETSREVGVLERFERLPNPRSPAFAQTATHRHTGTRALLPPGVWHPGPGSRREPPPGSTSHTEERGATRAAQGERGEVVRKWGWPGLGPLRRRASARPGRKREQPLRVAAAEAAPRGTRGTQDLRHGPAHTHTRTRIRTYQFFRTLFLKQNRQLFKRFQDTHLSRYRSRTSHYLCVRGPCSSH